MAVRTKEEDALIAELKDRIKKLESSRQTANQTPAKEMPSVDKNESHNSEDDASKKIIRTADFQSLTKENKKLNKELSIFRDIVKKRDYLSENAVSESIIAIKEENIKKITKERDSYKQEYQKFRAELIRFASVSKDLSDVEVKMNNNPDLNAYILQASALKQANEVLQRELQDLLVKETDLQNANVEKVLMRGRGSQNYIYISYLLFDIFNRTPPPPPWPTARTVS